ncbi:uncharacterized protein LOC143067157 isoform X2 [Mytilus galloprovincialis]|uniref:uncharacterized protein LOC143067157 isoform X2 n=1 Tax=Mytilus galloprovincialis TaxID=29158 RepID=UPI003F7C8461
MSVEWNPQIKYYISSQEKLIYITFDYPHKETGFNEFMARLVELDKDGNELRLVIAVIISQNEYLFQPLQPGRYKITVGPKNCNSCGWSVTGPLIIESNMKLNACTHFSGFRTNAQHHLDVLSRR